MNAGREESKPVQQRSSLHHYTTPLLTLSHLLFFILCFLQLLALLLLFFPFILEDKVSANTLPCVLFKFHSLISNETAFIGGKLIMVMIIIF